MIYRPYLYKSNQQNHMQIFHIRLIRSYFFLCILNSFAFGVLYMYIFLCEFNCNLIFF